MEFTYRISEAEYLEAAKLNRNKGIGSSLRKAGLWSFIFLCLMLLFAVVMKIETQHSSTDIVSVPAVTNRIPAASVPVATYFKQSAPGLVMACSAVFFVFFFPRIHLRRMYRKIPALQGEVKVIATTDSFAAHSSTGSTSITRWADIKSWCESKGLFLLIHPTRMYQIVNLRNLTSEQQSQFRGILATSIPNKK